MQSKTLYWQPDTFIKHTFPPPGIKLNQNQEWEPWFKQKYVIFFITKTQKLSYNKIFLLPDEVRWEELKFLTAYVVIMHQLSFSTDVQADTPQDQTVERKAKSEREINENRLRLNMMQTNKMQREPK